MELIRITDIAGAAQSTLAGGADVFIEAAQGYGLGLHTQCYPATTSADCTAIDALADCRISPWALDVVPQVWVVLRPYPIRIAGNSGPLYRETSWDELGLPEERTTVTNKVRRVGHWDPALARRAVKANGGSTVRIALMMMDQVVPAVRGMTRPGDLAGLSGTEDVKLVEWIQRVSRDTGAKVHAIGTGPDTMVFLAPLRRG